MELQLLLYGWPHQKNLMNILSQLRVVQRLHTSPIQDMTEYMNPITGTDMQEVW